MAKKVTQEEIDKALQVSIVDYITQNNIGKIINNGSNYAKLLYDGHDSLVINRKNNTFYHNSNIGSEHAKGNIINFVRYIKGYNFREAIDSLLAFNGETTERMPALTKEEKFSYRYKQAKYNSTAYKYLVEERKIDKQIVNQLFKQQYIMQDVHNNIIFNWTKDGLPPENTEAIIGATQQLTGLPKEGQPKKWIGKNSEKNWGFNIRLGNHIESIYAFEAAIDLLSYWSLNKNTLQNTWLVSLEGLKEGTLHHFLNSEYERGNKQFKVILSVDNDQAGHRFLDTLSRPKAESLISFEENIPYWNAITEQEINNLKSQLITLDLPYKVAESIYLTERPFLEKQNSNEQHEFYFNKPNGLKEIEERYHQSKREHTHFYVWETTQYKNSHLEERQKRFERLMSTSTVLVDEIKKDWNDVIKQSNSVQGKERDYRHENTKQYENFLRTETTRLSVEDLMKLSTETHLDLDILEKINKKGWLRKENEQEQIHLVWTKNNQVVGGERFRNFGKDGQIIQFKTKEHEQDSFIYTIGIPKELKLFNSSVEAISYLNLHKEQADFVAITDNGYSQYLVNKIQEYHSNHGTSIVTDCRNNSEKQNDLFKQLGDSQKYELVIETALSNSWKQDLTDVKRYFQLEKELQLEKESLQLKGLVEPPRTKEMNEMEFSIQ